MASSQTLRNKPANISCIHNFLISSSIVYPLRSSCVSWFLPEGFLPTAQTSQGNLTECKFTAPLQLNFRGWTSSRSEQVRDSLIQSSSLRPTQFGQQLFSLLCLLNHLSSLKTHIALGLPCSNWISSGPGTPVISKVFSANFAEYGME